MGRLRNDLTRVWARVGVRLTTGALAAVAAWGAGAPGFALADPAPGSTIVKTDRGPVQATPRGAFSSYFAIPYAAPPVTDLRWKPPIQAAAWTTPISSPSSAASCLQTGASPFRSRVESEDCLYLDVHTPVGKGPFPVMVWIHGGAFTTGSASVYADPSPLVSKGVIVVAINYRLGAMGFLAHPALRDADGAAGDYGIMDQQAALRWVRANIAAFGGDPRNVTIFGESAGGFSVLTHLASPLSAGLFDKAIIESGAYGVSGQLTQAELEARSGEVVRKTLAAAGAAAGADCAGGAVTAACLRNLPVSVVKSQLMSAFTAATPNVIPSVDGKVLPRTIKVIFAGGANNKVPVIDGSNESENLLFVALGEFGARLTAKPPNLNPADRSLLLTEAAYAKDAERTAAESGVSASDLTGKYYPLARYGSDVALRPALAVAAAGTDSTFSCNSANVAGRIARQGAPIWMYEFRDQTALPFIGVIGGKYVLSTPTGAAHAAELSYLFNLTDLRNAERKALQKTMSTYWTNFARAGDPNGGGAPNWAPFKTGVVQALDVASRGGVTPMPAKAFTEEHQCMTAWAKETF